MERVKCKVFSVAIVLATVPFQQSAWAADYMRNLGQQYFQDGQYQDAANILAIAASETPYDASVHYMRGMALAKMRRSREAIAEFRNVLALDHGKLASYSQQALATLDPLNAPKPKPLTVAVAPHNNETDEAAIQRLTDECDKAVERINKDTASKIAALSAERKSKLDATPQTSIHDTDAAKATIVQEYDERIDIVRANESNQVANTSAYYAKKLASLKRL